MIGFAAPGDRQPGCAGAPRTLRLAFHDIVTPRPGLIAPGPAHMAALLAFGASWDGARPLLVHCRMGISRSTAAAFVLACARDPQRGEEEIAAALRTASLCATPNWLMVALADDLLGRVGRMLAASNGIGRGADYVPQSGFKLACPLGPVSAACVARPGVIGSPELSVPRSAG